MSKTKPEMLEAEEAVALCIKLECPFCGDGLEDEVYFFKCDNKIMITCVACGETLREYLRIKFLEMGSCDNAGQCEDCSDRFKCYTRRGDEEDEAD